jgi:hypothetical protein
MPVEGVDGWPLYWPEGWTRTSSYQRERSRYEVNFVKARDEVLRQVKLMRGQDVVVSTNIPLRRDGLPLANIAEPQDPGVAVYWNEIKYTSGRSVRTTRVLACDKWQKVRDNLRAVGLTLDALRAIERAGASQVLERAFTGLTALPADAGKRPWRKVLGINTDHVSWDVVEAAYKLLALQRHPDRGGTHDAMQELNRAREEARQEFGR